MEFIRIEKFLNEYSVGYCTWIEKPENIITALALKPSDIEENKSIKTFLYQFKLFSE